ncbi:hypothetical protein ACH4VR_29725 [Streptomyces sp. NPDC020883]|uniref:hypothetical protein n=1 Tax=Streptomyces sp. NPDC020883 TaxID=3365099 RepID=UPI0037B78ECD
MGKASRGKKTRSRDEARQWSAAPAARAAHRNRAATTRLLEANPFVRAQMADNVTINFQHVLRLYQGAGYGDALAREHAAAGIMGQVGFPAPWPSNGWHFADWELDRHVDLLRGADICVISHQAHAAVVAAAMTLDPGDLLTLDREADIPIPAGLLVLPEPFVLLSRKGELSDMAAWGWSFATLYGTNGEQYPGVRISGFMDREGPVQPPSWRQFLAAAKAAGHPIPPWMPDGMHGMRADAAFSEASTETMAEFSLAQRTLHGFLGELARADPRCAPESAQWSGERIEDPYDDFAQRYLFAFWRLAAQGITTGFSPRQGPPPGPGSGLQDDLLDAVRVIDLRPRPASAHAADGGPSRYHHRWPVRMHKVRQWYPALGRHQLLWRGPYFKGPADAPLLVREKAYHVSA